MPREVPKDHYRLSSDIKGKAKLYVIAAEGAKTEYNYFTTLRKEYDTKFNEKNVHVEILCRPSEHENHSSPKFVEKMLDDFLEDNQHYDFKEYDELWFIIDTDSWKPAHITEIAEKCQNAPLYHLGLSNPCFEIWLILHLVEPNAEIKTFCVADQQKKNAPLIKKCIEALENNDNLDLSIKNCIEITKKEKRSHLCKQLLNLVREYYHVHSEDVSINKIPEAIQSAKQLDECEPSSNNYPKNICTNVYKLVETLTQQIE